MNDDLSVFDRLPTKAQIAGTDSSDFDTFERRYAFDRRVIAPAAQREASRHERGTMK